MEIKIEPIEPSEINELTAIKRELQDISGILKHINSEHKMYSSSINGEFYRIINKSVLIEISLAFNSIHNQLLQWPLTFERKTYYIKNGAEAAKRRINDFIDSQAEMYIKMLIVSEKSSDQPENK